MEVFVQRFHIVAHYSILPVSLASKSLEYLSVYFLAPLALRETESHSTSASVYIPFAYFSLFHSHE